MANKRLADALLKLSEQRRTVLLMSFFLGYNERKIGSEYGKKQKHSELLEARGIEAVEKGMVEIRT